ncbi:exodeoxyribonuclease V subunit alpha [Fodinibius salsisoli]|uniref:Exodeoxyribonuclease V subunit alpha n=1 Tax=Fodinibius salsisoli TaxID=2820877 RepID=A0ABT3PQS7_9BACT|nr:exodeoxyribonuclease V subunit alpha [Fodinibius salsisoli]MCW9708208.1 exodeoxyribonuclease V subunit alpha [Fodinibius salsisoli]
MNKILEAFNQLHKQDIIEEIDLELCRFLAEQHPDVSDDVLKAACLVSHLYRQGDVCLQLDEYAGHPLFDGFEAAPDLALDIVAPALDEWLSILQKSSFIGSEGSFKPLILDDQNRLYLHKLWYHEKELAESLLQRCESSTEHIDIPALKEGLSRLFPEAESDEINWQKVAAALAVQQNLMVISGGPGTGKTSTVVRILALLIEQGTLREELPSIALTAPTGKAAARLQESIRTAQENLPVPESIQTAIPDEAVTLHQLLGARRHTARFKHNKENPLPYDVVIVDEVSMVDQRLMSRLMEALLKGTKLILLGDKDQLASVEAGSVLGDICMEASNRFSTASAQWLGNVGVSLPDDKVEADPKMLTDHVTLLTKSYRFDESSGIARLSESVNAGDVDSSLQHVVSQNFSDISLIDDEGIEAFQKILKEKTERYFQQLQHCNSPQEAFDRLAGFRILAAHRKGPWGIRYINQYVEKVLQQKGRIPKYAHWYPGKPIIINVNDYALGLFNGDTGICYPNAEGELRVYFQQNGSIRAIAPGRLPDHNRAYALTVHKSQGSEFDHILFVLPAETSGIVSRELIYTAVTRARTQVSIWASRKVLKEGISKNLRRASGLADRLWHK